MMAQLSSGMPQVHLPPPSETLSSKFFFFYDPARDNSSIATPTDATTGIDQILAMDDHGHIIERGTHQQLLAMSDKYARMWELQRQQEIDLNSRLNLTSSQPLQQSLLINQSASITCRLHFTKQRIARFLITTVKK